ncbi:MAG: DUF1080 domain-containing protein [Planctomycetota bacterium]
MTSASHNKRILIQRLFVFASWIFFPLASDAESPAKHESDAWQHLLDQDLSNWETFIGVPHTSIDIEWDGKADDGISGKPLGLDNDPLDIFSTRQEDGETILVINGLIYGGLTSLKEYENYHLSLEFRWGEKKLPPRENRKRDSGLLVHCVGSHGQFWNVWMRSLECQIQEGDVGDFIPLAGSKADFPISPESEKQIYSPESTAIAAGKYVAHGPSKEKPRGQWNHVEVYTLDQTTVFMVNGTPNMVLLNCRQGNPAGKGVVPLTRGRIQIQSEAAEIEYRRIKLRAIESFPDHLSPYVNKEFVAIEKGQ